MRRQVDRELHEFLEIGDALPAIALLYRGQDVPAVREDEEEAMFEVQEELDLLQ